MKYYITEIRDKNIIEAFFSKNPGLYVYQLGDLDDFFFKFTKWHALIQNDEIKQIVFLYYGSELPVLLAIAEENVSETEILLKDIAHLLPKKFYSHLSAELKDVYMGIMNMEIHGRHFKMNLNKNKFKMINNDGNVRRLSKEDYKEIKIFYESNYPDNWFDKRMLETGKYFGYIINEKITGVAGIHVYSEQYKTSALGNIVTDVNFRGKSICQKLTSVLCEDLFLTVEHIGLNVSAENAPAIKCYKNLGFEIIHEYREILFSN